SPAIGPATLGQTHALTAASIATPAPAIATPALGQAHALSAVSVSTPVPAIGAVALGQKHVLGAANLATGPPAIAAPALGQAHALTAVGVSTSAPVIGTPALGGVGIVVEGTVSVTLRRKAKVAVTFDQAATVVVDIASVAAVDVTIRPAGTVSVEWKGGLMRKYVRGNLAVIEATFKATDGSNTQPASAWARVSYHRATDRVKVDEIITLTLSSGVWAGTWDTTPAAPGCVDWYAKGEGSLAAADEGKIEVVAGPANKPHP
ncbi:MAG: hypothetical protein ACXWHF_03025, partial [Chthoniobacterales bacterium]